MEGGTSAFVFHFATIIYQKKRNAPLEKCFCACFYLRGGTFDKLYTCRMQVLTTWLSRWRRELLRRRCSTFGACWRGCINSGADASVRTLSWKAYGLSGPFDLHSANRTILLSSVCLERQIKGATCCRVGAPIFWNVSKRRIERRQWKGIWNDLARVA